MIEVKRVERYGVKTYEQPAGDAVRRELCLCRHCEHLREGDPANCSIAEALFQICLPHGMAVSVTRCDKFERRGPDDRR